MVSLLRGSSGSGGSVAPAPEPAREVVHSGAVKLQPDPVFGAPGGTPAAARRGNPADFRGCPVLATASLSAADDQRRGGSGGVVGRQKRVERSAPPALTPKTPRSRPDVSR